MTQTDATDLLDRARRAAANVAADRARCLRTEAAYYARVFQSTPASDNKDHQIRYLSERLAECEAQRGAYAAAEGQAVRQLAAYETLCEECGEPSGHALDPEPVRISARALTAGDFSLTAITRTLKEAVGIGQRCLKCEARLRDEAAE